MNTTYHKPVLVGEVLQYLDPQPGKIYVDATFGGGGHTRAILEKEPDCEVIAFDWDQNALEKNGVSLQEEFGDRLTLVWGSFAHLIKLLKKEKISKVDGILADFGTSQFQILNLAGFSFNRDSFLDMRMSPAHQKLTAREIINKFPGPKMEAMFFELGEERYSKQIVRAILEARDKYKINTTGQLVDIIQKIVPKNKKIHPATKVFQALRIYVNDELENIHSFLAAAKQVLNPDGRLVCISFHSLEDRPVKQFFKENREFEILTPKIVTAGDDELKINPSARSAKLRAGQKRSD